MTGWWTAGRTGAAGWRRESRVRPRRAGSPGSGPGGPGVPGPPRRAGRPGSAPAAGRTRPDAPGTGGSRDAGAGWVCSWCAARRGGCGITGEDRVFGVDRVPPGVPDPPRGPFPPGYPPGAGAGGAPGRQGRAGAGRGPGVPGSRGPGVRGRGGRFAGAGGRRPRPGGSRGPVIPGGPDLPRYLTGAPALPAGPCAPEAAASRTGRPGPRRRVTPGPWPRSPDGVLSWPDHWGIYQRTLYQAERHTH